MEPRTAILVLAVLASAALTTAQRGPDALDDLRRSFVAPPPDSRIMMRWWWFGPAVTEPELERELRLMKAGGIGGVEIQPVYPVVLDDPGKGLLNLPYLSDDFISALRFAADKARELELRMDLTIGSGWPYGGPQVGVDEAAGKLRIARAAVTPLSKRVTAPSIGAGEQVIAAFLGNVDLGNVNDGSVRLPDGHGSGEVLFFIASRTGMMVKRAAVGAEGFVLNHYDRHALEGYLKNVGDRLLQAFGAHPPFAIFCDSLEVYESDWTADFLEQFRTRRGYDLQPHLPALAVDAGPRTAAIRHDWGETLTDLLNERFVEPMQEWARSHHTKFRMQAYGIPPATLSTNSRIDLPEGEGVQWKALSSARWASSASHVYDRPITSSETWTWLHSPSFRATPLDVKAEADVHFLQGVNQLVGHGWPYTAEGVEYPGWRFYAAGVFNDKNPWWTVMPDVSLYLQRLSFLMRQGTPVNDVAIYLPTDDAWAHFTPGRVSTIETLRERLGTNVVPAVLDAGFGFDFVDDEALRVKSGSYRAIVLPAVESLPIATLQRLEQFAERGGHVIATRRIPDLAPGFRSTEADHAAVRAGAERLFRATGAKGRLVDDERTQLGAELTRFMKPDVELSPSSADFGFVHRHTDAAEIYFLANTGNRPFRAAARVRLGQIGAEWWDPISGRVSAAVRRTTVGRGTTFDLDLEPYGSRVLVLSAQAQPKVPAPARAAAAAANVDISAGWKVTLGTARTPIVMDTLRSWTDDDATRFFSGVASYEREISIPAQMLAARTRIQLDLGEGQPIPPERLTNGMRAWFDPPVREAATVFVNGRRAGSLWAPPYAIAVTGLLHKGANTIRIDVANTAINYMAGRALPDYRLLNLRYGVRFEPQDMDMVKPVPSGLTGPIRLVAY
jgi:alpha-L-rhamnosidase